MTNEPKFTPGPWEVLYGNYSNSVGCDRPYDECRPWLNGHPFVVATMVDGYREGVMGANAALISCCPDLYANEEKNLETMRKDIRLLETAAKVCDLNPIVHLTVIAAIAEHRERVETTEKLLAKCKGEVKDE